MRRISRDRLCTDLAKVNADLTDCETKEAPGLRISVTWQEIEPAVTINEFPRPASDVKELLCATVNRKGHF